MVEPTGAPDDENGEDEEEQDEEEKKEQETETNVVRVVSRKESSIQHRLNESNKTCNPTNMTVVQVEEMPLKSKSTC